MGLDMSDVSRSTDHDDKAINQVQGGRSSSSDMQIKPATVKESAGKSIRMAAVYPQFANNDRRASG